MSETAILDGHRVVPVDDIQAWGKWMETHKYAVRLKAGKRYTTPEEDPTRVAHDRIGKADISTVFLGLNHNLGFGGRGIWFETMVFGGTLDGEQERYSTWDEAERGHAAMVARVREADERASLIAKPRMKP